MRNNKILMMAVVVLLISVIIYFYFFLPVPSFTEVKVLKVIKDGKNTIEWKRLIGVIDQKLPDLILVNNDTVCVSSNILNLEQERKIITITFSGRPELYSRNIMITKNVLEYKVNVDTSVQKRR